MGIDMSYVTERKEFSKQELLRSLIIFLRQLTSQPALARKRKQVSTRLIEFYDLSFFRAFLPCYY